MIHNSTTCRASLQYVRWLLGLILICTGFIMPQQSFSGVTSMMASVKTDVYPLSIEQPSIKTWSAYDSALAQNVCVRVANSGTHDLTVWLHHSQTVVGLFTVLPQHISAMCSVANKIELGCTGDSCESTWTVFDAP